MTVGAPIWMPTRKQLKSTYESVAQGAFDAGALKKLSRAPANTKSALTFKNVGIDGMKGREDLFEIRGELYVKNTKNNRATWYGAGLVPVFAVPQGGIP